MGAGSVRWVGQDKVCDGAVVAECAGCRGLEAARADMTAVVRASPSTALSAHFVVAVGMATPSRTTIAPPAWLHPGCATMPAIAQARRTHEPTQHWPEQTARTNAPCHTPPAAPPGLATRPHRKPAPVGPYPEHEDENGDANCARGEAWNCGVRTATCATPLNKVVKWVGVMARSACWRALIDMVTPSPSPPPALVTAPPSPPTLPICHPASAFFLARSPPRSPPFLPTRVAVVYVTAEPGASMESVTHTTASSQLVSSDSSLPNADVVAKTAIDGQRPTPAFAGNPIGTAYPFAIMRANRSAVSVAAFEYAVASWHDVFIDIFSSRANRDGVAHFHDDLSGSRSLKA